jgi:hypothetical protein
MWRRARLVTVGLRDAFDRGILSALDLSLSLWVIVKLVLWIGLVYLVYAAILYGLSEVLSRG